MTDMAQDAPDGRIGKAIHFLRSQSDIESSNRTAAREDLAFSFGDQWPPEIQNQRYLQQRPCLTINRTGAYIRQVCNMQRQQRPRITAHAADGQANKQVASVISGMIRHIQVKSHADTAYDTAFESAVRGGWGYWRVNTAYEREDSFDQEILIQAIDNPFTVYMDGFAPDGSDQENCLITDLMPKKNFRLEYPDANEGVGWTARSVGDDMGLWLERDYIRVAEHFYIDRKKDKLLMLSTGQTMWASQVDKQIIALWDTARIKVEDERESFKRVVKWCKLTAFEVLEEREWAGRWIPVVPCYGNIEILDGKRKKFGLVRDAKDPQRMSNFWKTSATESVALAPKAKWLITEGQIEGYENEWAGANVSATPTLRYKQTDVDGKPGAPPQRLQPEPPPQGIMEMIAGVDQDLSSVLGIVDPAMRIGGNVSGKALRSEKQQSDNGTFNFYDNMTRSMAHTGDIILDLIPKIYDTERVLRIIGEDGKPKTVTINQPKMTPEGAVNEMLNDVTVGQYAVIMDSGPGYESKRQESTDTLVGMMGTPLGDKITEVASDLVVRDMDFPSSDAIADRLAASNPLSEVDEQSEIPPQAQMMIKQLQATNEELKKGIEQLQTELRLRGSIEGMKQAAETQRTHIKVAAERDSDRIWAQEERDQFESVERSKAHDAALRAQTSLGVAEINAIAKLVAEKMNAAAVEKAAAKEDQQLEASNG